MHPTATILLPVYNAERYLVESLESLLGQTYAQFEILAINDASTDQSGKILEAFSRRDPRIRILTQPKNSGLIEILNLGLRSSSSRFIFRHDADDRAHPERIGKSISHLEKHPDVLLLGTAVRRMDSSGRALRIQNLPTSDAEIRWQFLFRNPFIHSTVVFDREKALSVGGYSSDATHSEDYDLWTKFAAVGRVENLPDTLCDYRVHEKSISTLYREEMESRSARIGSNWMARYSPHSKETWFQFRTEKDLTPQVCRSLFETMLSLVDQNPELMSYGVSNAKSDLAWHFLRYLKNKPGRLLEVENLRTLLELLPSMNLRAIRRWSST